MTQDEIREAIQAIGLALSANHGTIATDDRNAELTETSWRVDNKREVELLEKLATHLGIEHGV